MRPMRAGLLAGLVALTGFAALAQELPRGDAKALGFSPERLQRLDKGFQKAAENGVFPGAVVMIARDGKIVHTAAVGKQAPNGPPMTEKAIFRIYSMTKPIVSAVVMSLVEEGRLDLGDPLFDYIPEFKTMKVFTGEKDKDGKPATEDARRPITIQDLLRHTSGLVYAVFSPGPAQEAYKALNISRVGRDTSGGITPDLPNVEAARVLASAPLAYQPGTQWQYSHSTDVLGAVIEVVTGKPLSEVLKERIFEPLGMMETGFYLPNPADYERLAQPIPEQDWFGVFDPRNKPVNESGGAGLVSTVHDYARFAQMILNGGELDGVRILSPKTVAAMTTDQLGPAIKRERGYIPGPGFGFGLGYAVRTSLGDAPFLGTPGEFYWGGAGGTFYTTDPQENMFVLMMIQSPSNLTKSRKLLRSLVYSAMVESRAKSSEAKK